jgi:quercetin dioxygenase-like cupin family protein
MGSLRLRIHAETERKSLPTLRAAVLDEHQPGCFALDEERGDNWIGSGAPVIKEVRPTSVTIKREDITMMTRRGFGGVATCAICSITGFIATDASAQTTPGVTRKIFSQTDGPMPGYVTIIAEADVEPGIMVARHIHPGVESSYILEGNIELPVEGQPTRVVKAGDSFQIPPYTPHAGGKPSDVKVRVLSTYVVEKDKPLASPA